jgi:DNA-binding NarL/FixJ family response regulator
MNQSTQRIRVLVADDHLVFRRGMRAILGAEPDTELVGEATDGEEAVAQALELCPDVIVMDLNMLYSESSPWSSSSLPKAASRTDRTTQHQQRRTHPRARSSGASPGRRSPLLGNVMMQSTSIGRWKGQ